MGFQGAVGRTLDVGASFDQQFLFFETFRAGDLVRAVVLNVIDEGHVDDAPLRVGVAIFPIGGMPGVNVAAFATGRQLFSGRLQSGVPIVYVPASPDDSLSVRVPINHRMSEDGIVGVYVLNPAANARSGGVYLDSDIGAAKEVEG